MLNLKNKLFSIVLAASICSIMAGCSHIAPGMQLEVPQPLPPPASPSPISILRIDRNLFSNPNSYLVTPSAYRVGPQDVLDITVFDHPELTIPAGAYRTPAESGIEVGPDGTIFYPFIGKTKVAGLTLDEIRSTLTTKMAEYIRNPQISVRVANFQSQMIQVMGEVKQPMMEPITDNPLTLIQAINAAGGFNPQTSNPDDVFVIRMEELHPIIYILNANDPSALLLAENFYLKNKDVVYVAVANITNFNAIINSVTPTIQTVYYANALVH